MNGCKYIKKRIDEAEKPDRLPLDVSEHTGQCSDCLRFANERSAIRQLVAAGARVNAPINFDAVLKARLAEVKSRRSFWWLGSPGFFRLGAATAGLVLVFFAAQYAGLFSNNVQGPPSGSELSKDAPTPAPIPFIPDVAALPPDVPIVATGGRQNQIHTGRREKGAVKSRRHWRSGRLHDRRRWRSVLVRGRNGDIDMQMPTVAGAQPLCM
jgi:hypothetical protein